MLKKCLMACTVLSSTMLLNIPAHADELSDLKAQLNNALQRIEQLEAKQAQQAAPAAAPVVGVPAATPATAWSITTPSGFQWNIYGRGDIGFVEDIGSNTTVAHKSVVSNHMNAGEMTSRLGMTGSWAPYHQDEYKAIWGIESGINLFNGVAGGGLANVPAGSYGGGSTLLNRGATVGIASKTFGSLEGGNMYMAPFWVILGADLASAHDYGANDFSALYAVSKFDGLGKYLANPPNKNSGAGTASSLSGAYSGTGGFYGNALRYRTPNFDGFTGEFSFSMGQQPGFDALSTGAANQLGNDGKTYAGNIMYNKGPLFVGYAHQDTIQEADISLSGASNWQSRDQTTDIIGARYKWQDLEVGGSYTRFSVSNAGNYLAQAYGVSGSYDIGKHRIETSLAKITYGGANNSGIFGANTGDKVGSPSAVAFALGYLYNIAPNWSGYTYYERIYNNTHSGLDTPDFRGNVSASTYGFSPTEWTIGMFYVF